MSKQRRLILATVAVVVIFVLGLGVWALIGSDKPGEPQVSSTVPPLAMSQVQELADDLHSGDPARATKAVVLPPGYRLKTEAVQQLQLLRSLTVNADSLQDGGNGTATAVLIVTDANGKSTPWATTLVWSDDHWAIALTTEGS